VQSSEGHRHTESPFEKRRERTWLVGQAIQPCSRLSQAEEADEKQFQAADERG